MKARRLLALWCPDWPVRALGHWDSAVAVIEAGEVFASSPSARAAGVTRGLRRREAQARCTRLIVLERNVEAEIRSFEPIVDLLEQTSPLVEVIRPGLCMTATKGPSRYFGGDRALVEKVFADATAARVGEFRIGIAEGVFAAAIAARRGLILEPGRTRDFLAELPVECLGMPDIVGLLERLGIKTLGDLAVLPKEKVLDRFGTKGRNARLLALGEELDLPSVRNSDVDLTLRRHLEDPVPTAENMGFVARSVAADLIGTLDMQGLACRALAVEMHTVEGGAHRRVWHHEIAFDDASIADRVRWQLDGWLTRGEDVGPVEILVLEPVEVLPANGRQFELWGGENDSDRRVARAVARVQALVGFDSVTVPRIERARHYEDRVVAVPWDERFVSTGTEWAPWPGAMPSPSPSVLHDPPLRVALLDRNGAPVVVGLRGLWSATPEVLVLSDNRRHGVEAFSSPWLSDEKWWGDRAKRRASVQVVKDDGAAHLLVFEKGEWWLIGDYS